MNSHYYNINISWKHSKLGQLCSPELDLEIPVVTPPEFPGGIPNIWSPEHLFTAAVCSCFMTTFLAIAQNSKLEFISFNCESKGKLEQVDGKFLMAEIELYPIVCISNSDQIELAEKVLQKSEAACLISNSIKTIIKMNPTVNPLY